MTRFTEQLKQLSVTVTSPDRNLVGRDREGEGVTFEFADPDKYDEYTSTTMELMVADVLRGLAAGREQAVSAALVKAGRNVREPGPHPDAQRRRYREALAALVAAGTSSGGGVTIVAQGTTTFRVTIGDGVLEDMEAKGFAAELRGAYRNYLADRGRQIYELKREYFPS